MRPKRVAVGVGKAVAVALILSGRSCRSPSSSCRRSSRAPDIFAVPPRLAFAPTLQALSSTSGRSGAASSTGLLNSAIVTAGATLLAVVASTWRAMPTRASAAPAWRGTALFLIAVRLLPPIVITLPLFPIVNWLRLNDTHLVLIILYATFFVSLGTLLMRTFIDQIPRELDEAALVDGASRLTILLAGDPAAVGARACWRSRSS